jgi:hypothetical protein
MMSGRPWLSSWLRWVRTNVVSGIRAQSDPFTDEGLAKDGGAMSQIPTYVTGVPNGTEKVSRLVGILL